MSNIHVVTDSGSDLPLKLREELGIHVVPLTVQFGDDIYRDGVDIQVEEFYERLQSGTILPSTCQPSPADFEALYQQIAEPGDTIISVHLSSRLSGTYQSAVLASTMVDDSINIITIDSKSASMGIGLAAVAAAEAARAGHTVEDCVQAAQYAIDHLNVYFVVDTLEYLKRNGRIGQASALVGTLLNIKPILTLNDGVVAPFEKIRGKSKAIRRIHELARALEDQYPGQSFRAALTHAARPNEAQVFAEILKDELPIAGDIAVSYIGPTIGVHVGPGTLALLLYPAA
ncbi:MAG: DegV family protein [Firmicutes bacterium]|jgi:DegV family protein with EDD domain|nr:DegV family protein [Bacillota bacterium]